MINERKDFHPSTQYKSSSSLHIKTKLDEESYPSPDSIELNDLPINIIIENNEINIENEIVGSTSSNNFNIMKT